MLSSGGNVVLGLVWADFKPFLWIWSDRFNILWSKAALKAAVKAALKQSLEGLLDLSAAKSTNARPSRGEICVIFGTSLRKYRPISRLWRWLVGCYSFSLSLSALVSSSNQLFDNFSGHYRNGRQLRPSSHKSLKCGLGTEATSATFGELVFLPSFGSFACLCHFRSISRLKINSIFRRDFCKLIK